MKLLIGDGEIEVTQPGFGWDPVTRCVALPFFPADRGASLPGSEAGAGLIVMMDGAEAEELIERLRSALSRTERKKTWRKRRTS